MATQKVPKEHCGIEKLLDQISKTGIWAVRSGWSQLGMNCGQEKDWSISYVRALVFSSSSELAHGFVACPRPSSILLSSSLVNSNTNSKASLNSYHLWQLY
jgi:hypothetical protein